MAGNMLTNGQRALIHGGQGEYMIFTGPSGKKLLLQDLDIMLMQYSEQDYDASYSIVIFYLAISGW